MLKKITDLNLEDEFRRMESLLTASAELQGEDKDENDLSFELLDKVLYRVREINRVIQMNGGA